MEPNVNPNPAPIDPKNPGPDPNMKPGPTDPNMNPGAEDPKKTKMKMIIFCVAMILYGLFMLIISTLQVQLHPVLLFILSLIPVLVGIVMLIIVIKRK